MLIEHLIYSAALAVVVGMIFSRFTGRDPSWIIIAVAFVPDVDLVLQTFRGVTRRVFSLAFDHGDFHNIFFLIVFSLFAAFVLRGVSIRFTDGLICSALGIAAHLLEDALVSNPAYAFFWPLTRQPFGIGIMTETRDFFGIASSTPLLAGILLLITVVFIRTYVEGKGWWRVFLQQEKRDIGFIF